MRKLAILTAVFGLTVLGASTATFAEETEHKFGFDPESFEIKFYVQPRFTVDLTDDDTNEDTYFSVRRGRVYLTSEVAPNIKGRVQFEVKPTTVEALDVYFDWSFPMEDKNPLTLTFGQFKKPFHFNELVLSSSNLTLIDRPDLSTYLEQVVLASGRDQGAMLTFDLGEYDSPVVLMGGIFNGNGKGSSGDDNSGKQFVFRAAADATEGLAVGGNLSLNRLGENPNTEDQVIWGLDGSFTQDEWQVVSELVGGDSSVPNTSFLGWYAEAIYRAESGWEPAARLEILDIDTDTDDTGIVNLTGQIAKHYTKSFRWQLNLVHRNPNSDLLDSSTELISQWTVRL